MHWIIAEIVTHVNAFRKKEAATIEQTCYDSATFAKKS